MVRQLRCSRGRQYGVGILQPDYSRRRSPVSVESKQVRRSHRVEMTMPQQLPAKMVTSSRVPFRISPTWFGDQDQRSGADSGRAESELLLKRGQQEYVFPTQVARVMVMKLG